MIDIHINKGWEIRKLQGFDFEQLDGVTIDERLIKAGLDNKNIYFSSAKFKISIRHLS